MKVTNTYWLDKNSKMVNIQEMSDEYLANAIRFYMSHPRVGGPNNSLIELATEVEKRHEFYRDKLIEQYEDSL